MKAYVYTGGALIVFGMFGTFLYFTQMEFENVAPETEAYIEGATPPSIETWEMY